MVYKMKTILLFAGICLALVFFAAAPVVQKTAAAQPEVILPDLAFDPVVSGLDSPVFVTHAGDGSDRLFIVEQPGRIRIFQNGSLVGAPFLDISSEVLSPASGGGNEEGLLSVAFPPGFGGALDHFYVYYTRKNGDNQLSRFSLSGDPNQADPNSEESILIFDHPGQSNHNGGQLVFGPDSYLYIGTGDGGGGGDPNNNAQNTNSLLGKLLRIDVEPSQASLSVVWDHNLYLPLVANAASNPTYTIPVDNPFTGMPGFKEEIWAYGLRNPWRFSFDRATGDLYIGDVGQNLIEEVDYQPASSAGGENYGWNIMEGSQCYKAAICDQNGLVIPVTEYDHGEGCSVTGGYVYRGSDYPDLNGIYFFGDYCSGIVWGLLKVGNTWQRDQVGTSAFGLSSFGEDESGELYLANRSAGTIYQLMQAPQSSPFEP
jgi:glucose/arabinose dehydrogenase